MDGDDRFSILVQQLYDVHLALEFVARSSVRPKWFDRGVEARDALARDVLAGAAERLSGLLGRQVSVDELEQLGRSEALTLLTPGLTRQQDAAREALRKTLDHQLPRRTAGRVQMRAVRDVRPRRRHPLVSIALGVGISVLAATAAAPIAALAVQESIARELVKATITGVVSGTVMEVARSKLAEPAEDLSDRVSDLERKLDNLFSTPSPGPIGPHGQRAATPYNQGRPQGPASGGAKLERPKGPYADGPPSPAPP